MTEKTCATCDHWYDRPPVGEAGNECRAKAPVPGEGRMAIWPQTKANDFCGEWKKRAK